MRESCLEECKLCTYKGRFALDVKIQRQDCTRPNRQLSSYRYGARRIQRTAGEGSPWDKEERRLAPTESETGRAREGGRVPLSGTCSWLAREKSTLPENRFAVDMKIQTMLIVAYSLAPINYVRKYKEPR